MEMSSIPSSALETSLLSMVEESLEKDALGVMDNFISAGGDPLLGTKLVVTLRSAFGVNLTPQQLHDASTVEGLTLMVERKLAEERLASIWMDLLGLEQVGLDANLFDLGGSEELLRAVKHCIATEFGQDISLSELTLNPTIRQQAQLVRWQVDGKRPLPEGVLALQSHESHGKLFWIHYLTGKFAMAVGDHHPFLLVSLTARDCDSLGEEPSFKNTSACLMKKILATQEKGPYVIGGFCLGGILAFEIASQMRAAGHEVSLLLLLDTPSPCYFKSPYPIGPRLSHPRYVLKRAARLGLRTSLRKITERMFKCFDYTPNAQLPRTEGERAQKVIESAAKLYRPEKYDGKTVLLLASDRPPHLDFHTGWQELVPHNLETQYLDAHHSELVQAPIVLGSECTSGLRGMFWRDAGWRPPGAAETNVYGVGAIILGV